MKLIDLKEFAQSDENRDIHKAPAIGDTGEYVTSAQAAKLMGVTMGRIRQYVMEKRLKAKKPKKGRRDLMFKLSDIKKFKEDGVKDEGRPPKDKKDSDE